MMDMKLEISATELPVLERRIQLIVGNLRTPWIVVKEDL